MLNEVLFMEIRLFRLFLGRTGLSPVQANRLFKEQRIWSYIEDCYDSLHLQGDETILEEIMGILNARKAL